MYIEKYLECKKNSTFPPQNSVLVRSTVLFFCRRIPSAAASAVAGVVAIAAAVHL